MELFELGQVSVWRPRPDEDTINRNKARFQALIVPVLSCSSETFKREESAENLNGKKKPLEGQWTSRKEQGSTTTIPLS